MAPRGAAAIRIDASAAPSPHVLSARPSEWPGLSRLFVPRRKYLTRWTGDAQARRSNPAHDIQDTSSLAALIEADLQILFGEIWDLVRANPRTASAIAGIVMGYVLWA